MRVAISGGFDPLHSGHTRYIDGALSLGKELIVILTGDAQLVVKKGYFSLSYDERAEILEWGLNKQDKPFLIVPNVDGDITSKESLETYQPDIFAKGGSDWDEDNLPEADVCKRLGIRVIFGVGGFRKLNSSRWIVERRKNV